MRLVCLHPPSPLPSKHVRASMDKVGLVAVDGIAHVRPRRSVLLLPTLLLPEDIPIHVTFILAVQLKDGKVCAVQQR